jgi:hypothetical protein
MDPWILTTTSLEAARDLSITDLLLLLSEKIDLVYTRATRDRSPSQINGKSVWINPSR